MAQWFTVLTADRRIKGWQRSSGAKPADTAEREYIDASDADLEQYTQLQAQARTEGRPGTVLHSGGALSLPTDRRPRFRIAANRATVDRRSEDAMITLTAIDANGDTRTTFNDSVNVDIFGRLLKFDFANGVASRSVTFPASGVVEIRPTPAIALEAPLNVTVVE